MSVIGVAEQGFTSFEAMSPADVFVPLAMKTVVTPTWDDRARRNSIWLRIFARLKPGVDPRAAQSAMAPAYHSALESDLKAVGSPQQFWKRYLANTLKFSDASRGFGSLARSFSRSR